MSECQEENGNVGGNLKHGDNSGPGTGKLTVC